MTILRYLRAALGPSADGPADADLLGRFVRDRDQGAFELLVWRHAGLVLRTCRAVLRDHHAAEDAAQATFLALARKAGSIGRREALAGWLYRVARRIAVRAARRGRPFAADLDHLPAPIETSDPDLAPLLHEELARLPEKYRLPVLLCYFQGLSHADAAKQLGWPVGSVAGRIARAKDLLHRRLTRRGVVVPAAGLAAVVGAEPVVNPAFAAGTAAAAVAFAAGPGPVPGVSDTVLQLAHEGIRTMSASKLSWAAGLVALCGTLTLGGIYAGGQGPQPGPGPAPGGAGLPPPTRPADPPPEAPLAVPLGELPKHKNGDVVTVEFLVREVRRGKSQTRKADDGGPDDLILGGIVSLESDDRIQVAMTGPARPDWDRWEKANELGGAKYLRRKVRATGKLSTVMYYTFPAMQVTEVTVDDPTKVVVLDQEPVAGTPPGPGGGGGPPRVEQPPEESRTAGLVQRKRSLDNLKKILQAVHNYEAAYGHLPADIKDKDGKPLLSWRVLLLPYLEQDALYKAFKLDESWDSPHNFKLLSQMPSVYRTGIEPKGATHTYYQAFAGPGTAFDPTPAVVGPGGEGGTAAGPGPGGPVPFGPGGGPGGIPAGPGAAGGPGVPGGPPAGPRRITLATITDGTSNTLGVVEAGPPVPWTKPADLPYDPKKPLPKLAGPFSNALHVAFLDGSTRALRRDVDETTLRQLIEVADGQIIPPGALRPASLPATTPEEKQQLKEQIDRNQRQIGYIEILLAEHAELLGAMNQSTGDIGRAEEMAELLKGIVDELKARNKKVRDELGLRPGGKVPKEPRKE